MKTISLYELAINRDVTTEQEQETMVQFVNAFENMPDNLLVDWINTHKLMEQTPDLYVGTVYAPPYGMKVLAMPFDELMFLAAYEVALRGLSESI